MFNFMSGNGGPPNAQAYFGRQGMNGSYPIPSAGAFEPRTPPPAPDWPPGLPYPDGMSVPPQVFAQLNDPNRGFKTPETPAAPSFAQPGLNETFSSQAYMDAMKPAEFIGRKAPQKPQAPAGQPQAAYASAGPGAPSKDVPGSGIVGFVQNGALPVFKKGFAGSPDEFGPVPQHAMSGKRVGVEEGSFAHHIAGSPVESFLKLFGYGGGF